MDMFSVVAAITTVPALAVSAAAPKTCLPYSEQACRAAALALGLSLGSTTYPFLGSIATKGCYAYRSGTQAGQAYYSTGGTEAEMKADVTGDQFRPRNYDCVDGGCKWWRTQLHF